MQTSELPPHPGLTQEQRDYLKACGKKGSTVRWPDVSKISDPAEREAAIERRRIAGQNMAEAKKAKALGRIHNPGRTVAM